MDFSSKKVILFDLDGTITDSGLGIFNSFKYAFKHYGISDYDDIMLNKFLGPPLTESFMSLPGFDEARTREAIGVYREYYKTAGMFENELYVGIDKLLKNLAEAGKKVILATSKAEVYAVKILEHFDIARYFFGVAGSELDGSRIKKDAVISYALDKCGVLGLADVVMVGDREHDIIGAQKVGVDSIGVLYGYGSLEELESAGATAIVETVENLGQVLLPANNACK